MWVVDSAEAERVVRVPVRELIDPANRFQVRHPLGYQGPAFLVDGMVVCWALRAGSSRDCSPCPAGNESGTATTSAIWETTLERAGMQSSWRRPTCSRRRPIHRLLRDDDR